MLRITHERAIIERTTIEFDDLPSVAEFDPPRPPEVRAARMLVRIGGGVLCVVRALVFTLGVTGRVVLPVLGELACIALAAVCCSAGLLGRGLDSAGRAVARNSRVLTAGAEALARLPSPRLEREPKRLPAIAAVRDQ